jgi:hypothetical protein
MGEATGVVGQINRDAAVETFVNTYYTTSVGGFVFSSQKMGVVTEVYPLPALIGGIGGTLIPVVQVITAHGMMSSGVGTVGGPQAPIGTISASVMATIAATLLPNQFLAKVYSAPAGTLVEAPTGTITAALAFLLKGY